MKRAVIIATGASRGASALDAHYPSPMLPLGNRPFIQHVVEFLAAQGVREFDWVLSYFPEQIEHFLGDGSRWGSKFVYHLAREPARPYRIVRTIFSQAKETGPVLFGHADRLPPLQLADLPSVEPAAPVLFFWRKSGKIAIAEPSHWSGWAILSARTLANLPGDVDEDGLKAHLLSVLEAPPSSAFLGRPLSVRSGDELLASQRAVLQKQFPGLLLGARETDPGIWLSRNVALHPRANLVPPVYVGENCRIDAEVQLGPNVAVGDNCVLDSRCELTNALVFAGTYVGERVQLADKIVDKNCVVNAQLGTAVTVADHYILGSITDRLVPLWVVKLLAQATGCLLLLPALPVLLLTAFLLKVFRTGPVVHTKTVVRLPTTEKETDWALYNFWSFCPVMTSRDRKGHQRVSLRHFLLYFLPGLVNVARGNLNLVGVPPRSPEEINALHADWKSLYLHAKAGLVTEASVSYGEDPSEEELYASEGHYAVSPGWTRDLKILARYFGQVIFGFCFRKNLR